MRALILKGYYEGREVKVINCDQGYLFLEGIEGRYRPDYLAFTIEAMQEMIDDERKYGSIRKMWKSYYLNTDYSRCLLSFHRRHK